MNANSTMSANVSLVGVQADTMIENEDGDMKMITDNDRSRSYGFDAIKKDFEDSLNEVGRIESLKKVTFY